MKDINFLVEEYPFESRIKKERKSLPVVKVIVLIMAIALGTAILLAPGIYIRILESRASAVEMKLTDAKYSEVRAVKAQLTQVSGNVNSKKSVINAIDAEYMPASKMLLVVQNALPSGCFLTSLSFDGKSFTINGVAESSFILSDYLSNLNRLKLFESSSHSVSMDETQSAIEFKLTFTAAQNDGGEQ